MTRWLAGKAEELGVEIYPGFGASEVLYGRYGEVVGVATGDVGVAKDGSRKDTYARGTELRAKITLFGEGCRGSLSEVLLPSYLPYCCSCSKLIFGARGSVSNTVTSKSDSYIVRYGTLVLCV